MLKLLMKTINTRFFPLNTNKSWWTIERGDACLASSGVQTYHTTSAHLGRGQPRALCGTSQHLSNRRCTYVLCVRPCYSRKKIPTNNKKKKPMYVMRRRRAHGRRCRNDTGWTDGRTGGRAECVWMWASVGSMRSVTVFVTQWRFSRDRARARYTTRHRRCLCASDRPPVIDADIERNGEKRLNASCEISRI